MWSRIKLIEDPMFIDEDLSHMNMNVILHKPLVMKFSR